MTKERGCLASRWSHSAPWPSGSPCRHHEVVLIIWELQESALSHTFLVGHWPQKNPSHKCHSHIWGYAYESLAHGGGLLWEKRADWSTSELDPWHFISVASSMTLVFGCYLPEYSRHALVHVLATWSQDKSDKMLVEVANPRYAYTWSCRNRHSKSECQVPLEPKAHAN